jgi:hypothetical protein
VNGDTPDVVGGKASDWVAKALLEEAAAMLPAAAPAMPRSVPRREIGSTVLASELLILASSRVDL